VDGFRIDTLGCVDPQFAKEFAHEIREFAWLLGKRNFFMVGEICADDGEIARFIGRNTLERDGLTGADAGLDFPVFFVLGNVLKGLARPARLTQVFERRKDVHRGLANSRGELGPFFVTFLDNHDQHQRFYYSPPGDPHHYTDQVTLGLGCLFSLQGIPCLFYGTEQGLRSCRERYDEGIEPRHFGYDLVREAFWGKPNAFDRQHLFYQAVQKLSAVRNEQPALRYGRQHFRPISGNGVDFGLSGFRPGVVAFSRILSDQEIVVVANTSSQQAWSGEVIVDAALNALGSTYEVLFSNKHHPTPPTPVVERPCGIVIREVNDRVSEGPARVLALELQPMELQILGQSR
jgi:glycosidase